MANVSAPVAMMVGRVMGGSHALMGATNAINARRGVPTLGDNLAAHPAGCACGRHAPTQRYESPPLAGACGVRPSGATAIERPAYTFDPSRYTKMDKGQWPLRKYAGAPLDPNVAAQTPSVTPAPTGPAPGVPVVPILLALGAAWILYATVS